MGTHPIFESDFDCLTGFQKRNGRVAESENLSKRSACRFGADKQDSERNGHAPERKASRGDETTARSYAGLEDDTAANGNVDKKRTCVEYRRRARSSKAAATTD